MTDKRRARPACRILSDLKPSALNSCPDSIQYAAPARDDPASADCARRKSGKYGLRGPIPGLRGRHACPEQRVAIANLNTT
jgi:hypothetical protein